MAASLFNGLRSAGIDSEDISPLATSSAEKIKQKNKYPDKHAQTDPCRLVSDGGDPLGN